MQKIEVIRLNHIGSLRLLQINKMSMPISLFERFSAEDAWSREVMA